MILIIILNAVFAAFVLVGVVGLHLYAIVKDHTEQAQGLLVRPATDWPAAAPARHRRAGHGRAAKIGVVSAQGRAASGQALPLSS